MRLYIFREVTYESTYMHCMYVLICANVARSTAFRRPRAAANPRVQRELSSRMTGKSLSVTTRRNGRDPAPLNADSSVPSIAVRRAVVGRVNGARAAALARAVDGGLLRSAALSRRDARIRLRRVRRDDARVGNHPAPARIPRPAELLGRAVVGIGRANAAAVRCGAPPAAGDGGARFTALVGAAGAGRPAVARSIAPVAP